MKSKILADFKISISVPLKLQLGYIVSWRLMELINTAQISNTRGGYEKLVNLYLTILDSFY